MSKEIKQIKKQKKRFEFLLNEIQEFNNIEYKYDIATFAANYATYRHTGYYYSTKLEKIFTNYAKTINIELEKDYKPNSFLHVLTTAAVIGGHTRVVEKWIEQSPNNQVHSVVCIKQEDFELPQKLKDAIKSKNGELIIFETNNLKENAIKLRKIASKFEYVILHIHMDDPTALVAFGTEDFKRPVIFFNHADHMFWLGKSIIDKLATIKDYADIITLPKRNIKNSFMLGVPIESRINKIIDKNEAKKKINIDTNKKLIISIGTPHKYIPLQNKSIVKKLLNIVRNNKNIEVIIIGPKGSDTPWQNIYKKSNKTIKAIGPVEYNKGYFDYINAADLVIDSWPMGGGTVMIDAISCNIPVLTLKNPLNQYDYLYKSQAYCNTDKELYEKTKLILNNDKFRNILLKELKQNLEQDHSVENWGKKLQKLIELTPKYHTIKDISNEIENTSIGEADICLNYSYNPNFINQRYDKQIIYKLLYFWAKYILRNEEKKYKYIKKYCKYI